MQVGAEQEMGQGMKGLKSKTEEELVTVCHEMRNMSM